LAYETLPIVDWARWSASGNAKAGMWPVLLSPDGSTSPLRPEGPPTVKQKNATTLIIRQTLTDGATFSITCEERQMKCTATEASGKPLPWAWEIIGDSNVGTNLAQVTKAKLVFRSSDPRSIQVLPNAHGEVILNLAPR
jgi:hypothetical protein